MAGSSSWPRGMKRESCLGTGSGSSAQGTTAQRRAWALSADTIEIYERSATAVADAVIENPAELQALVPCVSDTANAACYREVVTTLGRCTTCVKTLPTPADPSRRSGEPRAFRRNEV